MSKHDSPLRLMVISLLCCLAVSVVTKSEAQQQRDRKKPKASAAELMRRAHQRRAQWDGFPGFTANLVARSNEQRIAGQVVVSAEGAVELQLTAAREFEWVAEDLQSLVDHRLPSDEEDYNVSFAADDSGTALGRLIRFNEDRMHSVYRIRGDVITEVHRMMGPRQLLISVFDVKRTRGKKYLPRSYSVAWTDVKSGQLLSSTVVNNQWTRVGDFDLPARILKVIHRGDGSREVRDLRFSKLKLAKDEG